MGSIKNQVKVKGNEGSDLFRKFYHLNFTLKTTILFFVFLLGCQMESYAVWLKSSQHLMAELGNTGILILIGVIGLIIGFIRIIIGIINIIIGIININNNSKK